MLFSAFAGPAYPITTDIASIINPNVFKTAQTHPEYNDYISTTKPP
jgi:hypothetical protein